MTSKVQLAPTFHFYKDGNKIEEYVGSSYPALEVSCPLLFPNTLPPPLVLMTS